jgi:two-component system, probable response regulator PhcQ
MSATHPPPPPGSPIVVCVDDDQAVLTAVMRCLRKEAMDVRHTTSPHEALSWITTEPVAVLVADYEMPELNGAQLAGQARRVRPETVRILLTGNQTLETAVDGINQGEIFRFISKPFETDDLRRAVLAAISRHKELVVLLGDRKHRERRESLRAALETEYPGITNVQRASDGAYEVSGSPAAEATELGLTQLTSALQR